MVDTIESGDDLENPMNSFLGYQLRRASNAMIADLSKRLMPLGLTVGKGTVLLFIDRYPGITQGKVARDLAIKRANMVPLIASLEERGLLSRTRVDGRSQGLKLTREGKKLTDRAHKIIKAHENKFAARISQSLRDGINSELHLLWEE